MRVNNPSTAAVQAAALAASQAQNNYEKNVKAFGPVAATAIGLVDAATQSSQGISQAIHSVEHAVEEVVGQVVTDTLSLGTDTVDELKSAYNTVSNTLGHAASAVAGYAETGVAAGVQILHALV